MATITKKQLADYEQLCKDRNNGRILTPDGLRFICAAYEYDPEKNRKTHVRDAGQVSTV